MVWESESSVILLLIKSLPHLSDRVVIKICSRLDFSLYLNRAIHVRGNADDARAAFVYGWNLKIHMICAVSQYNACLCRHGGHRGQISYSENSSAA
jgi:hypothetical protein